MAEPETNDRKDSSNPQTGADPPSGAARITESLILELRGIAGALMARERSHHTLQPTALVAEAYLRLQQQHALDPNQRTAYLAAAARQMRYVLIDHARQRSALRRASPGGKKLELTDHLAREPVDADQILDVAEAIEALGQLEPRQADVVYLRFFGGLTAVEASEQLGVSQRTVESDWRFARAWLERKLSGVT
jgi:RNA polymerase sigma-70 factor, ECF subfamily